MPQAFYASPLQRTAHTADLTFSALPDVGTPFSAFIVEVGSFDHLFLLGILSALVSFNIDRTSVRCTASTHAICDVPIQICRMIFLPSVLRRPSLRRTSSGHQSESRIHILIYASGTSWIGYSNQMIVFVSMVRVLASLRMIANWRIVWWWRCSHLHNISWRMDQGIAQSDWSPRLQSSHRWYSCLPFFNFEYSKLSRSAMTCVQPLIIQATHPGSY